MSSFPSWFEHSSRSSWQEQSHSRQWWWLGVNDVVLRALPPDGPLLGFLRGLPGREAFADGDVTYLFPPLGVLEMLVLSPHAVAGDPDVEKLAVPRVVAIEAVAHGVAPFSSLASSRRCCSSRSSTSSSGSGSSS